MITKVHLFPAARGEDDGQGGVRRVIEYQQIFLPVASAVDPDPSAIVLVDDPAEADVIACHIEIPQEWLRLYPDKAFVLHCHGLYWREYPNWAPWTEKANASVMEGIRCADVVTSPSQWVAESIARHTSRRAVVIPHGVEPEEWEGPRDEGIEDYVWWDKTRPDPICDPAPMNAVAALLPDVHFVSTFGEPAPNVTIVGHLTYEKAADLTRNAAVYLATSRETFGIATLQALAAGVPVVGFNFGAQPEILTPGFDSLLVARNDIPALARAIVQALEERDRLSAGAKETAARFSWLKACEAYRDVYHQAHARKLEEKAGPRTSIIVPSYNLGSYLSNTLNSVLRQADRDWECIIVDDASTDDSHLIAMEFAGADQRFRVIKNAENVYLAAARNIGIEAARGRYILPLDADDMLPPEAVFLLADELDRDRSTHIVYGSVRFVNDAGVDENYGPGFMNGHSGWPMPFRWGDQLLGRNLLPYSSLFRRDVWAATGGYRERHRTAEDADFWCRATSYGFRARQINQESPLFPGREGPDPDTLIYRNREGSMSRSVKARDWASWFGWRGAPERSPAGAVAQAQLPVPSLIPPAISVVIPVGPDHEKLVWQALDSLEAQTFEWWEALVVWDTPAPVPRFPPWVRVVQGGGGCAASRNLGIKQARAAYYLPLDADDFLQPMALETFWRAHIERPEVSIWYSDMWHDGPVQNVNYTDANPWHHDGSYSIFRFQDWHAHKLLSGSVGTVSRLVPRRIWQEIGGYDEQAAWEDWTFDLECAARGYCSARIARPLLTYRKMTGTRRETNNADFEASKASVLKRFAAYYEEGGPDLMACGCSNTTTRTYEGGGTFDASQPPPQQDAQLVQYVGPGMGTVQWRAPSTQMYAFGGGDIRYVLAQDVDWFLAQGGFELVESAGVSDEAPALV